jgi:TP901 family phage tail tape measure protein
MANAVGVSGEQLAAQIATIESVTREAPEQIGNGLKTLYARFSDIKLGKTDDGVDLGKVTETLDKIGVNVLDKFGNIREMDNILEDLMDV